MKTTEKRIDITLLENLRQYPKKLTARCPACAARGGDRRGEHFFLNLETGQFGCVANAGDQQHRSEISSFVGTRGETIWDTWSAREWRDSNRSKRQALRTREKLQKAAREKREAIVALHPWDEADAWEESPQRVDQMLVEFDPRYFLRSLFPPSVTMWTGEVWQSGRSHADRWKTVQDWLDNSVDDVGPMASPAIWKSGCFGRTTANVIATPYTVLDFDGFDGVKPETPEQVKAHVAASLALVRWLCEGLHWQLAALVHTGNKSIHAWFHTPPPAVLISLRNVAGALGVDAGLIGRGEHPCRLPGQIHAKSGKISRVMWLQNQSD